MADQESQAKEKVKKGLEISYQFKLENGLDIGQNYADLQKRGIPLGEPYQILDGLLLQKFSEQVGDYEAVREAIPYMEKPEDKARVLNALSRLETCWPHAVQTDFLDWLRANPKATTKQIKDQGYVDKLSEYRTLSAAKKEAGIATGKKSKK
jgi:hypothetical protein